MTTPLSDLLATVDLQRHAVVRWHQRVGESTTLSDATQQLYGFIAGARLRGRAPRWLPNRTGRGSVSFLSNPERPEVVVVVVPHKDHEGHWAAVTVQTRYRVAVSAPMLRVLERERRAVIRRKTQTRKSRRTK
jgi:hypothetical protein